MAKAEETAAQNHQPLNPPKPHEIAELFPELEILDLIGHGGMGFVYKARQKNLGRIVALKILSASLMNDPTFAERFSREARAMAMMNHPNIISIYDFGCREQSHYLVMEYVDGLNLRQIVQGAELSPAETLQLIPQLCDALQYAHDRGVVHRDIKPENVLVSQEGAVKIADFGLAKLTDPNNFTLTQTKQVMGTPNYMAPEQREKPVSVDHRADIYSLGVVIYELLTGELPLGRFAAPSQKVKIDVRLDEIVMRALEKEPNLRFQKVSELKTGIESLGNPQGQANLATAAYQNIGAAHQQPSRRSKFWSFVTMSIALLCGICGILLVIISGVIDDLETSYFEEHVVRIVGFSGMALCGLLFAINGIYQHVFHPQPAEADSVSKSIEMSLGGSEQSKEKSFASILLTSAGTITCFACAAFFTLGSPFPGISSWQAGIGAALLAGCLFSISELFEKNPASRSENSGEHEATCPRCNKTLKSKDSKQCFACGLDWRP